MQLLSPFTRCVIAATLLFTAGCTTSAYAPPSYKLRINQPEDISPTCLSLKRKKGTPEYRRPPIECCRFYIEKEYGKKIKLTRAKGRKPRVIRDPRLPDRWRWSCLRAPPDRSVFEHSSENDTSEAKTKSAKSNSSRPSKTPDVTPDEPPDVTPDEPPDEPPDDTPPDEEEPRTRDPD